MHLLRSRQMEDEGLPRQCESEDERLAASAGGAAARSARRRRAFARRRGPDLARLVTDRNSVRHLCRRLARLPRCLLAAPSWLPPPPLPPEGTAPPGGSRARRPQDHPREPPSPPPAPGASARTGTEQPRFAPIGFQLFDARERRDFRYIFRFMRSALY